tara:strand:+ start:252 stop:395 length:144 start_codon:yes stop_codon:yes gene_type:complete
MSLDKRKQYLESEISKNSDSPNIDSDSQTGIKLEYLLAHKVINISLN